MTTYTFGDDGIVASEMYFEAYNDSRPPIHVCDWFYNGKTLTVVNHRNRDKNGNYYRTEKVVPADWWIKNKTKEQLIQAGMIPAVSLNFVTV